MTPATHLDLYQLTSLVPHHAASHSDDPVTMAFFSRRLPKDVHTGEPARGYLLWAGLQRCLDHLAQAGPHHNVMLSEEVYDALQDQGREMLRELEPGLP